jgi:DNA-directed RNA polymerase specialized sigma24 family protein
MDVITQEVQGHEPELRETAFARLLRWLDDGTDSGGETYLEMRRRLVAYFDRRNRPAADVLADETFDRISRTLETSSIATRPPARYCYVIARFVLLEDIRREGRSVPFDEARPTVSIESARSGGEPDAVLRDRCLQCLDRCLLKLKPEQRELVIEYYRDAKRERIDRRRELANRMGITMNALGIRLCRIRSSLEACVASCCKRR